jgi:NEDD4-binding protein 2
MGNYFSTSKKLVIMRGLPGSGKTTLAKQIAGESGLIYSCDDFFTKDGIYTFNPKKLTESHEWNQQRATISMEKGEPLIIIDNTNTRKWEAKPYVKSAVDNGYEVEFVETNTDWCQDPSMCYEKGNRKVPLRVIERMNRNWEDNFTVDSVLSSIPPWLL